MDAVTAPEILIGYGFSHIFKISVPAVDKAVYTMLKRPLYLPVAKLGIFFVVVAVERRSFGEFVEVIEALVNSRRTLLPCCVVMSRNDCRACGRLSRC